MEPERQIGEHAGHGLATDRISGGQIEKAQTLLLTGLAFPGHFGESLLLAVVSWGTRQAAVQTLSHGLRVVVPARTGELSSMLCTCEREREGGSGKESTN